ncbi:MAG: hypothetical protein CMM48_03225 [Rhodospirillaceae bacterium]|nr:hypothetical protein [Rhodospirillaceae bacterium]HAA90986.1 DUF2848 domain-containing protein [Rhodospirillaceae bacterium]
MSVPSNLEFECVTDGGSENRAVAVANLVIAGWTGRDKEAMEKHMAELEEIGIPRPATAPCFYRASAEQLTQGNRIQVVGPDSSGEVEFCMVALEDGLWIGIASDHTDRKVEAYDVAVSKQMCAKPVGRTLWRFDEVADHWDELLLKSEAVIDGETVPYQQGGVANMLEPARLIELYAGTGQSLASGTIMFGGTLAVIGGVRPGTRFSAVLEDPVLGRSMTLDYDIEFLNKEDTPKGE